MFLILKNMFSKTDGKKWVVTYKFLMDGRELSGKCKAKFFFLDPIGKTDTVNIEEDCRYEKWDARTEKGKYEPKEMEHEEWEEITHMFLLIYILMFQNLYNSQF